MIGDAAEATWGIPGPTFLVLYLAAAVTIAVLSAVHRRAVLAGSASTTTIGPQQAAYLNGGDRLAVYTALGGLRAAGAIGTDSRTLVQLTALPAGVTPLDAAVHQAAGKRIRVSSLPTDAGVTSALAQLRDGLASAGLATSSAQRRAIRRWALFAFALAALGVVRLVAGIVNDRPVGLLIVSIIGVVVLAFVLLTRPRLQTDAGRAALADLRSRHAYLAPANTPSYATYGASGAAMGIALYGPATMYAIDPEFAAEAEIQRTAAGSASGGGTSCAGSTSSCGSSSSSCSSSSSSGSSCGGGGGCGG
ncbi:MAG TPA: TIGR04222 domain-containing membrane protein [Actinoplanes sp.]|nr:TIGR04222 domain-containing membrane protein [Actinoplanes sp.]